MLAIYLILFGENCVQDGKGRNEQDLLADCMHISGIMFRYLFRLGITIVFCFHSQACMFVSLSETTY